MPCCTGRPCLLNTLTHTHTHSPPVWLYLTVWWCWMTKVYSVLQKCYVLMCLSVCVCLLAHKQVFVKLLFVVSTGWIKTRNLLHLTAFPWQHTEHIIHGSCTSVFWQCNLFSDVTIPLPEFYAFFLKLSSPENHFFGFLWTSFQTHRQALRVQWC